ncbi:helix-turn-helix domain-containing protein [Tissierella sp. Yu-01]|uniref:helix-turn-helix domain-containing protein n=1 Tax=Tissierella sp. Yu-01 TaxID=3035694 RepID=UPI00240E93A8|nr:helix-turn-helix domain-containing protein [Tissierella sp. Yu-01]WFA08107.1 helix-turn-helix domain-containing protein [Tissierella sp. Yu-01]
MRKEYVEYLKDLPINIQLANITEYPFHWQDSIEILFVLKGSITIGVETETYTLVEREIEIINPNEVFRLESKDPDNLVLILDIDPNFFEKYYDDAKDTFYYTNSSDDNAQENEDYYILRRFISILVYEAMSKLDDYEDSIEENLLEMMYHLLNNFHYLIYEEESLKEDEYQLDRYHRIVKYISNNYMDKVSLQQIAEKEFLTTQYLSYKLKEVFGHSFNEYLNQVRVEESTKLLLDTDLNISEISVEVGFSHVRYYNKHFKLHYNMTPMQYRKKYKVSVEQLEKMKKIKYLDLIDAIPYIGQYIEDYERYNYDNRIVKLDIDLNNEVVDIYQKPSLINLGDISLLLEEENMRILKEIQGQIGFRYCIINRLFSDDMDIYRGKNHRFINWTRVENILDFIKRMKLYPIINTKGVEEHILKDFIQYFSNIYDTDVEDWLNFDINSLNPYFLREEISPLYDTMDMVPFILYSYTHENKRIVPNMIDEITKETYLSNDTFFGGNGLFTSNYLNKPSFYGFKFLSLLGDEIIYRGEGYVVTKSEEGYQILLFNPVEVTEDIIYGEKSQEKLKSRKISLNIYNMDGDFQITKYDFNKSHGSIYDKWVFLGSPERIDNAHWELLDEYVQPNVSFYYGKKSTVFNIVVTIKPNGVVLLTLNSVLN